MSSVCPLGNFDPKAKLPVVFKLGEWTGDGMNLSSEIRQSTLCYAGLLGGWDKRIVNQESDVSSIIFFILFLDLGNSKLFIFIFVILFKNKQIN